MRKILSLVLVLAACASAPPERKLSKGLQLKMENYVFHAGLDQLRQSVIDALLSEPGEASEHSSSRTPPLRPLQDFPFIYEGKLREPAGLTGTSPQALTESNWEIRSARLPYDVVESSPKRLVLLHGHHLYSLKSVSEKQSELRIYELQRFRRAVDKIRINLLSATAETGMFGADTGVVDLDASLHDATRDLVREWTILERVEPEKASRMNETESVRGT